MEADSGIALDVLRTDGGMVGNDLLMQFQADILNRDVTRPLMRETTALGAAYAAGLSCGFYKNTEELASHGSIEKTWHPEIDEIERTRLYRNWKKAVARSFDWAEN